jgi:integrase/recombinase XerD
VRQVKFAGKWMMLPMSKLDNGTIDWQNVVYKGRKIPAAEGTFFLEYQEDKRKRRRAVGRTVREAKIALPVQESVLELRAQGVEVEDAPGIQARSAARGLSGRRIDKVVDEFVARPPIQLRDRSIAKYSEALKAFRAWTKKTHVSQLGRQDILDFMAHLVREQGLAVSTAVDKAIIVHKAMKQAGAVIKLEKGDWPRVTKKQPEIYTPELLRPLFAAMRPAESVLYQTFLLSGFRDQEVGFLSWDDFNPKAGTLRVSKKAGYKFDPKNYKERVVPVPRELVDLLKRHRAQQKEGEYFVFPTSSHNKARGAQGGQRDKHMLGKLKRIALRAELNCGRCHTTLKGKPVNCGSKPVCGRWTLHKFRHTYATTLLHQGLDILSVQKLMGHDDIESTMKYLRALQQGNLADRINSSGIATMFL